MPPVRATQQPDAGAPSRRAWLGWATAALALPGTAGQAQSPGASPGVSPGASAGAAGWPQRPVRFLIPNAPASSVDTIGRLVMAEMARGWAAGAFADNRAGASGALGVEELRRAPADGHTLLIGSSSSISTAPLLQRAARYDPLRDLELLSLLALLPNALVCHPGLPVRSVADLVAWARSRGQRSNMASAGIGSASHLAGVALQAAAGFSSLHVPYKGGSQGVASVVSGETDWVLTPAPAAMGLVAAGRLRLLGHSMPAGTQPLGEAPAIAATVAGFEFSGWIGLLAPKGLSPALSAALVEAAARLPRLPELAKAFEQHGAVAQASSPQAFRSFLERDIASNRRAIELAGIQPE